MTEDKYKKVFVSAAAIVLPREMSDEKREFVKKV
jgi:hypothetical protein